MDLGSPVHLSCFDLSPEVMDTDQPGKCPLLLINSKAARLHACIVFIFTTLGQALPGANIPSGPGFVDKSNASSVSALAGIDR